MENLKTLISVAKFGAQTDQQRVTQVSKIPGKKKNRKAKGRKKEVVKKQLLNISLGLHKTDTHCREKKWQTSFLPSPPKNVELVFFAANAEKILRHSIVFVGSGLQ